MYAAPAAAAATADQPVPNILDLFGMSDSSSGGGATASPAAANTSSGGGGADLLQLSGNPFANIVNQAGSNGGGSSVPAAALDNGMMDCTAHTFLYLGESMKLNGLSVSRQKVIIVTFLQVLVLVSSATSFNPKARVAITCSAITCPNPWWRPGEPMAQPTPTRSGHYYNFILCPSGNKRSLQMNDPTSGKQLFFFSI